MVLRSSNFTLRRHKKGTLGYSSGDSLGMALGPTWALCHPSAPISGKLAKQTPRLKLKVQILICVLQKQSGMLGSYLDRMQWDTLEPLLKKSFLPSVGIRAADNKHERKINGIYGQKCVTKHLRKPFPLKRGRKSPK